MVCMTTRAVVRAITAVAIATAALVAVTGCTGGAPSGVRSSSAAPIGRPVDVPCATLVPDRVFTIYRRTFTLVRHATPARGSTAAAVARQRGAVCIWEDGTDHHRVTLAVASLPESTLTKLKDTLYEDSHSVPTYTVEGYFDVRRDSGRADAFADPYWITVESSLFGEPGDAQPVVDAVRAALGSGTSSPSSSPQAG
jgi:hypothetical protein